jgi:cellulose synthase/poly-beta-1,6-N-acetylglucosamine synthase-like glycosyltransferase
MGDLVVAEDTPPLDVQVQGILASLDRKRQAGTISERRYQEQRAAVLAATATDHRAGLPRGGRSLRPRLPENLAARPPAVANGAFGEPAPLSLRRGFEVEPGWTLAEPAPPRLRRPRRPRGLAPVPPLEPDPDVVHSHVTSLLSQIQHDLLADASAAAEAPPAGRRQHRQRRPRRLPATRRAPVSADLLSIAAQLDDLTEKLQRQMLDSLEPSSEVLSPSLPEDDRREVRPRLKSTARPLRMITFTTALVAVVCIAYTLPGAWLIPAVVLLGVATGSALQISRRDLVTAVLGVTVAAAAVDYLAWRVDVANWAGWEIAVPLLLAEMFGAVHVLGLQYTVWPKPTGHPVPTQRVPRQPIFVFIPTVNEGLDILGRTIRGAMAAKRRLIRAFPESQVTVVVCNDGRVANAPNWPKVEAAARKLGAVCITRTVPGGNKAGNIENARQAVGATGAALLAIFDADQVPDPSFLLKTLPHFADPRVGWVQTGQYYRNTELPVARWANDQQALFYGVLCPGKAAHNAAFICGTNVVIRAQALDEIGGLPQESVTEDFVASIELHPRWRSVFLTEKLATGLGPMDLPAYLRQQRRWAIGTIGVLRSHWRAIFWPSRGGLSLEQRVQYFLASTHYLCGLRDLIYIAAPIAFLVTGIPAVHSATLALFLWHFLPYWTASQVAFWSAGRRVTGMRGIVIGFGSFPALVWALGAVMWRRRGSFMLTSKQRRHSQSWRHLTVHLALLLGCLIAVGVALAARRIRAESMAISILWVAYDVSLLSGFLWLAARDLRYTPAKVVSRRHRPSRAQVRIGPVVRAALSPLWARMARWPEGALAGRKVRVVVPVGAGLAVIGAGAAMSLTLMAAGADAPPVLAAARTAGQSPHLGVSLPFGAPLSLPDRVASQLCLPLTVIGRTEDITAQFDVSWADKLAAAGQRPWIILQFGEPGPGGPPLNASLPAIENGVRDGDITRWADEVKAYARPVYLTVLLQVDRNWAVSSAVANGGIPQDVPRAWEHIQAIFREQGATNVAWVWSPADPAHDQPYAPPESTIDVVLQDLIRYPGTPWPNAAAVLAAASERHPGKPILLEVSAAGTGAPKAAWLGEVATAVAEDPLVFALVYRDGSPADHPSAADNRLWSVDSDPTVLRGARSWQALLPASSLTCQRQGAGP